ncbi:MAG TPA: NAD(P)/FAD-dependent oxidoreductase, partial [Steroidobacteraceae bacterium]|nr:NAD(P)/FAD-dependent oxidoreductase [Steroidobacteraceae bacterium]
YQFSFAPSINWSHLFPRHHEMQKYTEDLVDNFGLRSNLKLSEEATSAVWDDARAVWKIKTSAGKSYETNAVVAALGQLNRPLLPNIPGRETFEGPAFHSARWDHSVQLEGKRVAVIGSAASAVQIIPQIAKVVKHLTVFQRTPNWVVPRLDRPITDEEKVLLMTEPHIAMLNRDLLYRSLDYLNWQAFSWTPAGRDAFTRVALNHLEEQVPDAELRKQLTPHYPIGCKRVLVADDYYPALMRSNVALETDSIARITASGIETQEGKRIDVDVIVYATGFETTGWHWSVDVVGKDGIHLRDAWANSPQAYLGITTTHFPNLFILYGPNTNLGHNSITFMLERQAEYAVQALKAMRESNLAAIEVKASAQTRFQKDLQSALAKTVWADEQCHSWYKNAEGMITQNWSSHTRDYAAATEKVEWGDYLVRSTSS